MKFYVVEQLAVPTPAALLETQSWLGRSARDWLADRVHELSYTSVELAPFAQGLGNHGPPYRWIPERRAILQAEINAIVLHLYGLTRPQAEWLLDSFTVLSKYEAREHGEFRTRRLVLESFDALAEAMRGGTQHRTRLNPPPADPRVAHGAHRGAATPASPATGLPFRRLGRAPKREERYETAVPFLTLKAAAGAFGETQDVEFDEWVELANPPQLQKGMFLAQVTGRSMEPEIPDGSYCLFRYVRPGSREGKVVLIQLHAHSDPEGGGSYTVKRYHSEKERDEDGGWRHARIVLKPANPKFEPIVLGAEDEGEVKVVAELVKVL